MPRMSKGLVWALGTCTLPVMHPTHAGWPAVLVGLAVGTSGVGGGETPRFPKTNPAAAFSEWKIYSADRHQPFRMPLEDWDGARDRVDRDPAWQRWYEQLFKPEALLLQRSFQRVHNIACWHRAAEALVGLLFDDGSN